MILAEVLPILSGVVFGAMLLRVTARFRVAAVAIFALLMGVVAAFVSGEFQLNWGFALLDAGQVAGAAAIAFAVSRRFPRQPRLG